MIQFKFYPLELIIILIHSYSSGIVREPTIIPPTPTPSTPIPINKLPCVNEDIETDEDETTSLTTNGRNSSGEQI